MAFWVNQTMVLHHSDVLSMTVYWVQTAEEHCSCGNWEFHLDLRAYVCPPHPRVLYITPLTGTFYTTLSMLFISLVSGYVVMDVCIL